MTTATKPKPAAKRKPARAKSKAKAKVKPAEEPRPPLYERLKKAFDDLDRHFRGEDVGMKVTVHKLTPFALCLSDLKRAREAAGLTLAEVSARSGLRVETLSRLELGKVRNPTVDTLSRYAAAVGQVLTIGCIPRTEKPAAS